LIAGFDVGRGIGRDVTRRGSRMWGKNRARVSKVSLISFGDISVVREARGWLETSTKEHSIRVSRIMLLSPDPSGEAMDLADTS
jgi:hypothetical protein